MSGKDREPEKPEKDEIKVTDKRKFDEHGEPREDVEAAGETDERPEKAPEVKGEQVTEGADGQARSERHLPPMNFAAFLLSLSTMAMVYMGDVPNPETGKAEKNLDLAKQHIDILAILQEKTQGNLTPEEDKLLGNLLFELRMKYVALRQ